jgi:two-component system, OmpR family, response regulator BaeR
MNAHILIVEDQPELAQLVADYLLAADYRTTHIGDGSQALAAVKLHVPDLIVLDLMLPGVDGLTLARAIREFSTVPIIMTTARVEEIDRLLGLESGADDYLCKPFSPRELVARVKAVLRRVQPAPGSRHTRMLDIDEAARTIKVNGLALDLTPSEYALLAAMAKHPGKVYSRAQLLDLARHDSIDVSDRAIDSHVKNLRRKLALALPDVESIHAIYGLGYRFDL